MHMGIKGKRSGKEKKEKATGAREAVSS